MKTADSFVCVVNRDACIHRLTAKPVDYVPPTKDGFPSISEDGLDDLCFLPGANFVLASELKRFCFPEDHYRGRVAIEELDRLPEYVVTELAKISSVPACKTWLGFEKRPRVRQALTERLEKRGVRNRQ